MKDQEKIITSKVQRAMKLAGTGVKIGGNYIKYYAKKATNSPTAREELHEDNATDIYDSLSNLKGSALKVAQMLSLDKNILPQAYSKKFTQSQYSAPPLSSPLVIKTFTKSIGKSPSEVFDTFNNKSSAAASIGQVHKASLNGKDLAVKVQYPGVADYIQSDLAMVKPIANRMFGLNEKEMAQYFEEVEEKLLEETNYALELKRSMELGDACKHIQGVFFPTYYPELSGDRVLTLDWITGDHLREFLEKDPSQDLKNKVAQNLWSFYDFQLHTLKAIHADPHPGNFFIQPDGSLGIIDFGCVKEVPHDFYNNYFPLLIEDLRSQKSVTDVILKYLNIVFEKDSPQVKEELCQAFIKMTTLLSRPFTTNAFTFTSSYIDEIYTLGQEIYQIQEVKNPSQARGAKDALYINRTYFGLYSMLADLNATIDTSPTGWEKILIKQWEK